MNAHQPQRHLHSLHAMLLALGMIMSTDALKTAPAIAASVGHWNFLGLWVAGAVISMVGGLCYVEMAAAFPDAGGEYSFIRRAWGERVGTLYAWSRFAIMHTGWIALMAHLAADYIGAPLGWGPGGRLGLAVGLVLVMTGLNVAHVRLGFLTQALLVLTVALGFISVILAGIILPAAPMMPDAPRPDMGKLAVALIYIFLAYGGWTDAATLSAEVKSGRRGMFIAVIGSISLLGLIYVALNWALMRGLGEAALARSVAPAADLARMAFGWPGPVLVASVVGLSAVASINSMTIVCARTTYAAARDHPGLGQLAHWHPTRGTPTRAVLAVGAISLLLTLLSALSGSGFNAMVDYMTPAYWLFIAMGMAAAIRLRLVHPDLPRPVKTPLFPLFPALFILLAAYMLIASFGQLGIGAVLSVVVLALGGLLDALLRHRHHKHHRQQIYAK